MKKYVLSTVAEEDVLGIADYLAQANTTAARNFIVDFAKECERIATFQGMGRNRTEMGSEIMSLPFHRYLIYYQVHEKLVEILRVLHSAREVDEDQFV